MEIMTLREVCDTLGVSRRAIQGYEKIGLVVPSGKNERGYLFYDINAQNRIREIKLFQQTGFTLKEIKYIIDAPDTIRKEALKGKLIQLKEEKKNIDALICEVYKLLEM